MTNYNQVKRNATKLGLDLRADDPRFRRSVYLLHEEGTTFLWRYAFALLFEEWYVIFTEHHGTHVYHESDLAGLLQFEDVAIEAGAF